MRRTQGLPLHALPLYCLPADSGLPGQAAAQLASFSAEPNACIYRPGVQEAMPEVGVDPGPTIRRQIRRRTQPAGDLGLRAMELHHQGHLIVEIELLMLRVQPHEVGVI
jgi:hypothetical protein